MSFRQHAAKPNMLLWMLIAVGDLALVLATAGIVVLIVLASVVIVTVGAWLLVRQGVLGRWARLAGCVDRRAD